MGAFMDLRHLASGPDQEKTRTGVCHLFDCPRLRRFSAALQETIETIEKSKSAFKSKELGDLRRRLEQLVKQGDIPCRKTSII